MSEFKIDRADFERDANGHHVVARWIVEELSRGNEPATGSSSYIQALADEVHRARSVTAGDRGPERHGAQGASGDGVMNIDLDDLERKASDESAITPWWTDRMAHALHIQANSPPVTIALVARIRELESAVGDLITEIGMDEDPARRPSRRWNELDDARRILEKGVVLP